MAPVHVLTDAQLATELRHTSSGLRLRQLRQEALRRLPVRPLVGGGFMVASRTTKGAWWLVAAGKDHDGREAWLCTCPATVGRCYHVRQVEAMGRLDSLLHARPSAPPNVSGFVD